ncbi:MAG: Type I Iterative PKS [Bathelium mastoideum]|nr:MAG: Type I Iterative PKS [Bathelium mastoideum]
MEDFNEPIAIVGMGCRLPGNIGSPSDLWNMLSAGHSGHCDIPLSRFNDKGFYNPTSDAPESTNSAGGYFLQRDIRSFDNAFFGINNLEAKYMDPQQRQLLEVVYECFENAGVTLEALSGANVGCYIANFTTDFQLLQCKGPEDFHRYSATGMGLTILANRISHTFNLKGPSFMLDTACSSSLYALHIACVALQQQECESAIVAGANLIQSPEIHIGTTKTGVLSQRSICNTFDANADGYGRAEGIGALFLKRLTVAIKNGDVVRSVIRGTAVNSNGKTNGITLPSVEGQEAVIRKAYAKACLKPFETDYVEAHGTGTAVGDPTEVEALSRVFRHHTGRPTLIGSVKTNLGHSEAVSGISSIIKVCLALEKRLLPPTIGINELNPKLHTEERNVHVVTEMTDWPESAIPRVSINSFGYGGANAHAILEAADVHVTRHRSRAADMTTRLSHPLLLPFSAEHPASLEQIVSSLISLRTSPANTLDLIYTLCCRRSRLKMKGFIIKRPHEDINAKYLRIGSTKPACTLPLCFLFTGQGAQWAEMGCSLILQFPSFRRTLEGLDDALARLPDGPIWKLKDILLEPTGTSRIHDSEYAQPACTALQIALVELLREFDVEPSATLGHSSGEICAAYAAHHITASQAIAIAYYRGQTVSRNTRHGSMLAVGLDANCIMDKINENNLGCAVQVACINSPENTTISGDADAIESLQQLLQKEDVFCRIVRTDGNAYHSLHMTSLSAEYEAYLLPLFEDCQPASASTNSPSMISSITGQPIQSTETRTAAYWSKNLELPVRFQEAVKKLLLQKSFHFIEIGPHPVLKLPLTQTCKSLEAQRPVQLEYCSSLKRGFDSHEVILRLAGNLFINGHNVNLAAVNQLDTIELKFLPDLPTYPWRHDSLLWHEPRLSEEYRQRQHPRHSLLGARVAGGSSRVLVWRNNLSIKNNPWLQDHKLGKTIVFPAAGYIVIALLAFSSATMIDDSSQSITALRKINFHNPLPILLEDSSTEVVTTLKQRRISEKMLSHNWWEFEITSHVNAESTLHASGLIGHKISRTITSRVPQFNAGDISETQDPKTWYKTMSACEINAGPAFQSLDQILVDKRRAARHVIAKTKWRSVEELRGPHGLVELPHPTTIDAAFQTAWISTASGMHDRLKAKVPVAVERIDMRLSLADFHPTDCTIRGTSDRVGFERTLFACELFSPADGMILAMDGIRAVPYVEAATSGLQARERYPLLKVLWKPDPSFSMLNNDKFFERYAEGFGSNKGSDFPDKDTAAMGAMLDLLAHRNPRLHILDVGINEASVQDNSLVHLLDPESTLRRCTAYTRAYWSVEGKLLSEAAVLGQNFAWGPVTEVSAHDKFDLIIMRKNESDPPALWSKTNAALRDLLQHCPIVITACGSTFISSPVDAKRRCVPLFKSAHGQVSANWQQDSYHEETKTPIILVGRQTTCSLAQQIMQDEVFISNWEPSYVAFPDLLNAHLPAKAIVICFIELHEAVLCNADAEDFERIKFMIGRCSILVWVTGGGLYKALRPEFAPSMGLSRAIMLENPALKFITFDLDPTPTEMEAASINLIELLSRINKTPLLDLEYFQHAGVLHISRFVPDPSLNRSFAQKEKKTPVSLSLEQLGRCQLSIKREGQLDTIHFVECPENQAQLKPEEVEVRTKFFSLNAKDLHVLSGRVDTRHATCSVEFTGVVERIGSAVFELRRGDSVLVMAPNHFGTFEIVPQWACCKLLPGEDLATFSTIPGVFATAIYALKHRAQLEVGESILIHSAASSVGIAAIQIAKMCSAKIFATVSTKDKRDFLINRFGLEEDHIFSSRDSSFLPDVMRATSGRGVNVVLNFLTGDLLHDSWRACSEFGRFVEIGKRDILDGGRLDMDVFERGVTFTAFDLSTLFYAEDERQRRLWKQLLCQTVELFRNGQINAIPPPKVFCVSDIVHAFRSFALSTRIGKIVVSLDDPSAEIKVVRPRYQTKFTADKVYILFGCLGGIGRSLAKWMFGQGARRFVFLGRSGAEKPSAKSLVQELSDLNAAVDVVRGDVCNISDVQETIARARGAIGGVVQAAMGLDEALFSGMSIDSWRHGIDAKISGSWNIHNALKGKQEHLDFFILTSSISGTVGTATESNYCAANAFQDSFARFRRSQGLQAVSIGLGMISEVGYLHEHPDIEALLLRKGLHPLNEGEMLQLFDIAIDEVSQMEPLHAGKQYLSGHILTGLETQGIEGIRERGFEGGSHVLDDPRASIMSRILTGDSGGASAGSHAHDDRELPDAVLRNLVAKGARQELLRALQSTVGLKISNLLLLPADQLDAERPLSNFGLDSMLAAELRSYIYHSFKADVPFMTLLAKSTTVASLAESIAASLEETRQVTGAEKQ